MTDRERFEELIDQWATGEVTDQEEAEFERILSAHTDWEVEAFKFMELIGVMRSLPAERFLPADVLTRAKEVRFIEQEGKVLVVDFGTEPVPRAEEGRQELLLTASDETPPAARPPATEGVQELTNPDQDFFLQFRTPDGYSFYYDLEANVAVGLPPGVEGTRLSLGGQDYCLRQIEGEADLWLVEKLSPQQCEDLKARR